MDTYLLLSMNFTIYSSFCGLSFISFFLQYKSFTLWSPIHLIFILSLILFLPYLINHQLTKVPKIYSSSVSFWVILFVWDRDLILFSHGYASCPAPFFQISFLHWTINQCIIYNSLLRIINAISSFYMSIFMPAPHSMITVALWQA